MPRFHCVDGPLEILRIALPESTQVGDHVLIPEANFGPGSLQKQPEFWRDATGDTIDVLVVWQPVPAPTHLYRVERDYELWYVGPKEC